MRFAQDKETMRFAQDKETEYSIDRFSLGKHKAF